MLQIHVKRNFKISCFTVESVNIAYYVNYGKLLPLKIYLVRNIIFKLLLHFYFHYPTTARWWKYCFRSKFSVSNFQLIYMFWGPLSKKKEVFGSWSVCLYVWVWVCVRVCVCKWVEGEYLALYISKINKDRNTRFYPQYETSS